MCPKTNRVSAGNSKPRWAQAYMHFPPTRIAVRFMSDVSKNVQERWWFALNSHQKPQSERRKQLQVRSHNHAILISGTGSNLGHLHGSLLFFDPKRSGGRDNMSHSCPTLPAFTGAGKVRSSGVSRRSRASGTWPAGSAWAGGQIIVKECGLRTDVWIIACCVIYTLGIFRFNYTHTLKKKIHDIHWHILLTRASMTRSYCTGRMQTVCDPDLAWSCLATLPTHLSTCFPPPA